MARRVGTVLVATTFALAVVVVTADGPPASAAARVPTGYLVVGDGYFGPCHLATVDLATGVVVGLPAPPSDEGCGPIAVAPDGVVWGLTSTTTTLVDDNGAVVYVDSYTLLQHAVDGSVSARFPIGSPPPVFTGGPPAPTSFAAPFTIRPDGTFLFEVTTSGPAGTAGCGAEAFDCTYLFQVDPTSGTWSKVGPVGPMTLTSATLAGCRDRLFVDDINHWGEQDLLSGALMILGPAPAGVFSLGCSVTGETVYGLRNLQMNENDPLPENEIGTVDRATGTFTGSGVHLAGTPSTATVLLFTVGPPDAAPAGVPTTTVAPVTAVPAFTG